ncbi:MAG: hypothetical protein IJZ62_03110, partial [Clostridia bacterium]|nr:hypothetical protein [Clostridia bacterium]
MAKRMLKRIYITMALLFVTGICCFIPNSNLGQTNNFSANAEEVVASDGTWANIVQGGSTAYSFEEAGTSSSPYKIENATDLAYLAYSVNTGTDYAGQYISLLDDLDLGDALWTPIGTDGNHFKGTFLGNGHTISNITISDESNLYSAEYLGLFGVVENASILDLKLAGTYFNIATTYSALSTENKGTFAGQALNSIFSNCRDEMESTEDYPSIFTSNGTIIYKSGSFNGVTADLITQEAVDNSFVDGSGNSSVAYLARYVLKDEHITDGAGFHYFDATGNEVSGGNKYISVPVTSSMSADGFAWGTDTKEVALALGFDNDAPVLRENAGAQQFYVRYPGYKANIPQLFTASFDKGLILNITFNDSGESGLTIYFDYDYGARTNEFTGTIGYDQSFVEIADQLESNKVFDRAGYTLTYFANDKDFNEANITSCFTRGHTTVSSNSFPIAGATYYLTVDGEKNKANHGEGLINFLISSEEGGSFSDYNDIFAAIDGEDSDSSKKVTIKSATGSTEGYETSGIYQHSSLGYPVAEMAYLSGKNVITFTLAKGYQIDISNRDNGSKEGSSTSLKDYAPSGIYLNFANHTGKNAEYSLTKTNGDGSTISANNDDYASVNIGNIRVTTNTDKSTTYEIEIDNLLGGNDIDGDGGLDYTGNGEINIVIERAWVTYDITPIWMGDAGSIPTAFSYSYKITELAGTADYTNENLAYLYANTDEKESEIEVSLNDSSAVFSYDSTIDKYILNERVYLKLRYNEYVKLEFNIGDGQDYVVIGASCRDDDKSFVRKEPTNNNKTMHMERSSSAGEDMPLNLLSRDDNGAYTSTLYQLPQITSPQTLVRVKYYDENGNALSNEVLGDASSKYYNISIAVNDTKGLQNTDSTLVNVKSSGKIQATNNKFYKVKEIQIGQGVDWTTAVATHSFAQNGSNFPIIWGGMSYITAINQDSVEYEIRVYLEKVKYQVLVSSEFKDESIDDTNKSNFFTVAPTIYHVDDEGNTLNSGTSLWLEWDQKFKIDWTLSDLGKKLFITESVNGIKAYEKHYCPSSDEMPNVANITSLNKNTSTTILAEDVPASWAMTITWENRKAQVSIEEAVDKDGNTISTALNGKTLVSLDFVYDADNNSIVIADTTVGSISVSNAYYFTGFRWVDVSVEAKDYTESFGQFLTDADFVSFIIEKAYEAGNSTT